ncbi:MAG: hypothetical protein CMK42_00020 [Porticoccaceae bacterium]|jgi:hypothetical protein|nr:hypothetical protein [Porticoccaceae bacterium]|tara:strand:+ start:643 stop:1236 length:594 start_codon:yes stop_codon:yes gene_type:complete
MINISITRAKRDQVKNKVLIILLALLVSLGATSALAETNTVTSTVTGTTTVDKTPPTASAPNVMINNQDVCSTGTSAAVQTQIFGIAGGTTIRDLNCERLKLSRSLYGMGMKVAAVSLLCQDARVFEAMEMAGTPCPYKGKIGIEAAKAWAENPEKRPDYDKWLKENDLEAYEKEWKNKATTWATGLGGLALLLFLL